MGYNKINTATRAVGLLKRGRGNVEEMVVQVRKTLLDNSLKP